uniref:Probable receptor-like protein kinase At1g67000 n=1 Tax=Nicotiana sylvestris TaxID=4096 RepID=A0A1U7VG31_NICSY|nr:PREDICTED: probable receptor-like protein kinase At1g67000 [Nicotiana sylvestris]
MDLFSWFFISILFQFWCFDSAQGQNTSFSSCTKEFQCGNLGNLSFPFYKSTQLDCGLCKVNCEATPNPIIELDGVKYQALEKQESFIKIKDTILGNLLGNKSCLSFDRNLSLPISPSIKYRISSFLTLFKCNNSQKRHEEVFTSTRYHSYNSCESFILYYNLSMDYYPRFPLPSSCSFIRLPVPSNSESKSENNGLFDMLTDEVVLVWIVSDECNQCYYRGGQCQTDKTTNKFLCYNTKVAGNIKGKVIVAVASFLISCTGILILLFCFRKKIVWNKYIRFWESNAEDHRNIEAFLKNYGSYAPKRYNYSEVKRITSRFKNKLGQGGFGSVYKGTLPNGSHVAVKVLNELKGSGEEFINEVSSISRTSHVNVVSLVGFCFEGRKRALIYEFMPNGSLEKFIYEERSDNVRKLGWPILYKIALGIARGLEYLHRGCNTRILHFDIKPHNILLDDDFCPKISDFGLAKLCVKKESVVSMLGARGTIGYIAPEIVCRNLGGVSHKSDVYSYGMMVLEMVGGRKNVDVGVDRTSEIYFPHWLYRRIELDEELQLIGIMNEEEKECAKKMVIMSLWCIQTDPSNRPSMSKVVEILEGNQDYSLQIPPKPYLYSSSISEEDSSSVAELR